MVSTAAKTKNQNQTVDEEISAEAEIAIVHWPLDRIEPNPWQPRLVIAEDDIKQRAGSLKRRGQIHAARGRYKPGNPEIIELEDGEVRWRALQYLQTKTKKVLTLRIEVGPISDREMAEWAVESNQERKGNTPIEIATAYKRIIDEFKMTQDEMSKRSGMSRSALANLFRLLELPPEVQTLVSEGKLSPSHGKALASYNDNPALATALAELAVANGLSSKAMEKWPQLDWDTRTKWQEAGLIAKLPYGLTGAFAECEKCPFNALRRNHPHETPVCIKPDHFAVLSKRQAELDAEAAKSRAKENSKTPAEREQERQERLRKQAEDEQARYAANIKFLAEARAGLDATRKETLSSDSVELLRDEIEVLFVDKVSIYDLELLADAVDRWGVALDIQAIKKAGSEEAKRRAALRAAAEQIRTADLILLVIEQVLVRDSESKYRDSTTTRRYVDLKRVPENPVF